MAGEWVGREQAQAFAQPVGVVDPGFARAGAIGARQMDQVAGVLGQASGQLLQAAKKEEYLAGDAAGQGETLLRDADGKLTPPTLEQTALLSDGERRRRQVLASRYGSEFVLENQRTMVDLRAASGTDPDGFLKAATQHRDGVLAAMPPALRGPVGEGLTREAQRHYASMQTERLQRERETASAAGVQVALDGTRDYANALAAGAPPEQLLSMQAGTARHIDGMVAANLLAPDKAAAFKRQIEVVLPMRAALTRESRPAAAGGGAVAPYVAPQLPEGVDAQTDQMVRTVIGEAGSESRAGKLAVAHVILTRARESGQSVTDVIFANKQFEPWGQPATRAKLEAISPNSSQYQAALAVVRAAQQGEADPTGGATHFYSPRAQAGLGRPAPSWDDGKGTDLGGHRFFKLGYGRGSAAPGAPPAAAGGGGSDDDAPTRALATATALLAGPAAPGWRPEWNALRQDEREGLAQTIVAQARLERAETEHGRVVRNRTDGERSAIIYTRLAEIERAGEAPGSPGLSEALRNERMTLEQELTAISARTGSAAAAQAIRAGTLNDRQQAQQRGAEDANRLIITSALGSIAGGGETDNSPVAQAEAARVAHLPLQYQAQELARRANEYEQDARRQAAALVPVQRFNAAIAGGAQVDNNAVNQSLAIDLAAKAGEGDPLSPSGQGALVLAARGGVVPQQVVVAAASALAPGGDPVKLMTLTALHQRMDADPVAQRNWLKAMDPRLIRAFAYLQTRLPGLDVTKPENRDELNVIRANASKIAAGGDIYEDAKAALGKDAATLIDGEVERATGTAPASLPPAFRARINAMILEGVVAGQDLPQAATLGLKMLQAREGWGQSSLGATLMPQPESRSLAGQVLAGDFRGERPARWVQHPPEQHTAPFGAGGEVGTRWLSERVRDLAKVHGLPNAESLTPGRDLILRIDDDPLAPKGIDGQPRYQLHYNRAGIWMPLRARDAAGQETAAPLRLDLAAEAKEHRERWSAKGGGADQLRAKHGRVSDLLGHLRQSIVTTPIDSLALPE